MNKKILFVLVLSFVALTIFSQSAYAYKLIGYGHDSAYIKMWNPSVDLSSTYQIPYARAKNAWYNTPTPAQIIEEQTDHQHKIYARPLADTLNGVYTATWFNLNGTAKSFNICLNDATLKNQSYDYVQSVIVHEFGHAFGLDDNPPGVTNSIMYYDRVRETIKTPQQDDINGVNDFYN